MENRLLSITDGASFSCALSSPINDRLKQLIILRRDQLAVDIPDAVKFVLVQSGDKLDELEEQLAFSVFQNPGDATRFGDPAFTPGWEWIEDHGFCFELVFIFDDSGFAHVVLIERAEGLDAKLLALCTAYTSAHV